MAFKSQVVLNDPSNVGGTADAVLVYDLEQALNEWSRYIAGKGTLVVQLNIVQTAVGREDGAPTSSYYVGSTGALNIFAPSSLYELTNGQHENGTTSDITIEVSPSYFANLDLSQDLGYYSVPAVNKYNPVVVFMHELMHGFGLGSDRNQDGHFPGNYESTFDTLTQINSDGSAYYIGANGEAAEGGPVRITTSSTFGENYSHFGNTLSDATASPTTVQDPLSLDLMNGIVGFYGYRYPVSKLDLGVLKDLGYTLRSPAVHDFNGDGKTDILWLNDNGAVATWTINDGQILAAKGLAQATADWKIAGTGDFNGDGLTDILWRNDNGAVGTWDMNDGQILSVKGLGQPTSDWKIAGTGDFNGDGKTDILWHNDNGVVGTWDMNDGQILSAHGLGQPTADWKIAGTGDFNGDGKTDILWRSDNGTVATWDMNDSQIVSIHALGQVSADWKIAGTGDFNDDGKTDILWRNNSGTVATWDINDGQIVSIHVLGQVSADWKIAGTGDFNADGKTDVCWRNDNGTVATWDINDGQIQSVHIVGQPTTDWHIIV